MSRVGVVVEVWPIATDGSSVIVYGSGPLRSEPLGSQDDPGEVAANLLRHPSAWLHSTSWRLVSPHVVLTYLAVLDKELPGADWVDVAHFTAETPAGDSHAPERVLRHALRHLAFLLLEDGDLRNALPALVEPAKGFRPGLAGELLSD